jgi:hypothetical protein
VTSGRGTPVVYFKILGCGGSPHTSTDHLGSDVFFCPSFMLKLFTIITYNHCKEN